MWDIFGYESGNVGSVRWEGKYCCFSWGVSVSIDIFADDDDDDDDDDDVVSFCSRLALFVDLSCSVASYLARWGSSFAPLADWIRFQCHFDWCINPNIQVYVLPFNRARVIRWICACNTDRKNTIVLKPKSTNSNSKWWPEHWCGPLRNDPSTSGIVWLVKLIYWSFCSNMY